MQCKSALVWVCWIPILYCVAFVCADHWCTICPFDWYSVRCIRCCLYYLYRCITLYTRYSTVVVLVVLLLLLFFFVLFFFFACYCSVVVFNICGWDNYWYVPFFFVLCLGFEVAYHCPVIVLVFFGDGVFPLHTFFVLLIYWLWFNHTVLLHHRIKNFRQYS